MCVFACVVQKEGVAHLEACDAPAKNTDACQSNACVCACVCVSVRNAGFERLKRTWICTSGMKV